MPNVLLFGYFAPLIIAFIVCSVYSWINPRFFESPSYVVEAIIMCAPVINIFFAIFRSVCLYKFVTQSKE